MKGRKISVNKLSKNKSKLKRREIHPYANLLPCPTQAPSHTYKYDYWSNPTHTPMRVRALKLPPATITKKMGASNTNMFENS